MKNIFKQIFIILIFSTIISNFVPKLIRSYSKKEKLIKNLKDLKEEKNKILIEIKSYEEKTNKLETEYYKEELARNYLKMVKPGEEIYKVIK